MAESPLSFSPSSSSSSSPAQSSSGIRPASPVSSPFSHLQVSVRVCVFHHLSFLLFQLCVCVSICVSHHHRLNFRTSAAAAASTAFVNGRALCAMKIYRYSSVRLVFIACRLWLLTLSAPLSSPQFFESLNIDFIMPLTRHRQQQGQRAEPRLFLGGLFPLLLLLLTVSLSGDCRRCRVS